jgi:hypothetical protein
MIHKTAIDLLLSPIRKKGLIILEELPNAAPSSR